MRTARLSRQGDFLRHVQHHVAVISVGPSTARGKGREGVVEASRRHLGALSIERITSGRESVFSERLDAETKRLVAACPPRSRCWGLCRKVLNIFLRDCLYNHYLREAFRLAKIEAFLETPLDSIVAGQLRTLSGSVGLPRWTGLIRLTPDVSGRYQAFAQAHAASHGIHRVHLDAFLWSRLSRDLHTTLR